MKIGFKIAAIVLTLATLTACIGTVLICNYATNTVPRLMEASATPEETVNAFFSHISAREFEEANGYLSSETMTLSTTPDSDVGKLLYDALWDTFSYSCIGSSAANGLSAVQTVTVTYLDIPAVTAMQRNHMLSELEQLAEASEDPDALLDDDGYYNTEISLEALANVTADLLEDPDRFMATKVLSLGLEYVNYEWKIIADEDLYQVLSGNTY